MNTEKKRITSNADSASNPMDNVVMPAGDHSKRKFFYIDLSACEDSVKKEFMGVEKIPVVESEFGWSTFDVLESELPVALCNYLRHEKKESIEHIKWLGEFGGTCDVEAIDFMPIGVSRYSLPTGAVIRPA